MTETAQAVPSSRTPVHLWIVGVLALLWSAMGCFDYLATQFRWDFYLDQFTQEQLDYFYGAPAWMDAAWALGVWAGLAGAIGLLVRRRWAVAMFALSLLALAVSTFYSYVLTDITEILGAGAAYFCVVIWALAIFLLLYARRQAKNGVLR